MKKLFLILLLVIAGVLTYAYFQPADFTISRSIAIGAPAEAIYAEINDLHRWKAWSPWAKIDPMMKESYEGAESGVGATYHWDGNYEVGKGSMTIIESKAPEMIRFRLDFEKPMTGTNSAEFTLKPSGSETVVRWTMTGKSHFICRIFCLFSSMDTMVGSQFEKGLSSLKSLSESVKK